MKPSDLYSRKHDYISGKGISIRVEPKIGTDNLIIEFRKESTGEVIHREPLYYGDTNSNDMDEVYSKMIELIDRLAPTLKSYFND